VDKNKTKQGCADLSVCVSCDVCFLWQYCGNGCGRFLSVLGWNHGPLKP